MTPCRNCTSCEAADPATKLAIVGFVQSINGAPASGGWRFVMSRILATIAASYYDIPNAIFYLLKGGLLPPSEASEQALALLLCKSPAWWALRSGLYVYLQSPPDPPDWGSEFSCLGFWLSCLDLARGC